MLVLTRKAHETIHIGDAIVVEVLELSASRVKIGVKAPDSDKILRGELKNREPKESVDAA